MLCKPEFFRALLAAPQITSLDDFMAVMQGLSPGARVPVEYVTHVEKHRPKTVLLTVDRQPWNSPPLLYQRDDSIGLWSITPALTPEPSAGRAPAPAEDCTWPDCRGAESVFTCLYHNLGSTHV